MASQNSSKIRIEYLRKGVHEMSYGRTKDGKIVPFTIEAAKGISEDEKPLKKLNGTIVGKIRLSDKVPFLNIDRSETALIEALTYSEYHKGSPYESFMPTYRIIDPEKIETEKNIYNALAQKSMKAFVLLSNDKEEMKLLSDAFGIKKPDSDLFSHWMNYAQTNPTNFLSYIEQVNEETVKVVEKLRVDAILQRAVKAKICQVAGGVIVFEGEKLGIDFNSAALALRDNTPKSGKAHYLPIIIEKLSNGS